MKVDRRRSHRGGLTQNTKRQTQFHLRQNVQGPWVLKNPEGSPPVLTWQTGGFLLRERAFSGVGHLLEKPFFSSLGALRNRG